MKEYRIRAYFDAVYAPRSYKGKIFCDKLGVEKAYKEALDYYSTYPYLVKVVIEEREVTAWKE